YLLSDVGARQVATARWDGLFALTVTIAALAAFAAWSAGRGWTWFWLAAAVSALTKGPLGVLLAAFGLVAVVWERRSGHPSRLAAQPVAPAVPDDPRGGAARRSRARSADGAAVAARARGGRGCRSRDGARDLLRPVSLVRGARARHPRDRRAGAPRRYRTLEA